MDVIYTDKNFIQQGYLNNCDIDLEIGKYESAPNDFQISMNKSSWDKTFNIGSLWFVERTEYGGIIGSLKIDTATDKIILSGKTFRGMFEKEYIQPPANNAYYTVKGEMNSCLPGLISGRFNDLVVVDPEDSGIQVNYQIRDLNLLEVFEKMNKSAKVNIQFLKGKMHLSSQPIKDLSERIQYDNSIGLTMTVETPKKRYNHILALGKGELLERLRVNLYLNSEGKWVTTAETFIGLDRITYKYEDTNEDNVTNLTNNAIKKVDEERGSSTVQVSFVSDDAELFDIVGAKEEITGISFKQQITSKILKASLNGDIQSIDIQYKVGDN